jgi:ArsR family transcriptional regulator, arsenate/arsenite/antimonite-responsive transcriptional repressor
MESKHAAASLNALGHATRLAIYRLLVSRGPGGLAAGSIGDVLKLAPATLSFHLRELAHAGLIHARQQSRFIYYSADSAAMNALMAYLARNCRGENGAEARNEDASDAAPSFAESSAGAAPPLVKPVIHPKRRVT